MTLLYYPIPGLLVGFAAYTATISQGFPQLGAVAAAIVAGVLAMMAWSYSPLPDHNGGMLAGTENRGWGWGSDE